jgi:hypothetical protein
VKIIALLAVVAVFLADVFGSKSSVGGPMTDLLVTFLIMLAAFSARVRSFTSSPII